MPCYTLEQRCLDPFQTAWIYACFLTKKEIFQVVTLMTVLAHKKEVRKSSKPVILPSKMENGMALIWYYCQQLKYTAFVFTFAVYSIVKQEKNPQNNYIFIKNAVIWLLLYWKALTKYFCYLLLCLKSIQVIQVYNC